MLRGTRLRAVNGLVRRAPALIVQRVRHALPATVGALLVAFHVRLLWLRLAEGSLSSPAIAARWAAASVLFVALLLLRRAGIPLFWGRKALVFGVLVLALHATSGAAVLPVAATTALCTLLLVARLAMPAPAGIARQGRALVRRAAARRRRAWLCLQVPRPPPLALAR